MSSVFYSSRTNSTLFTTCCEVAILDHQQKCPKCRVDVYPFYEGMSEKERDECDKGYYNSYTSRARHNRARAK